MAIIFVNAGAEGSADSADITLGAPASPQTNDVWIAVVWNSAGGITHAFTDWTQIRQTDCFTGVISVWYHRYAGSTPNLTVTFSGGTAQTCIGGIASFRGVKTSGSPVLVSSSVSTGTDDTIEATSVNVTVDQSMVLHCNGSADDNSRTTIPSGFTKAFEDTGGGTQNCYVSAIGNPDGSVALHYQLMGTGNTGTITDTQAAVDRWGACLVALEPAAAVPPTGPHAGSLMLTGVGR